MSSQRRGKSKRATGGGVDLVNPRPSTALKRALPVNTSGLATATTTTATRSSNNGGAISTSTASTARSVTASAALAPTASTAVAAAHPVTVHGKTTSKRTFVMARYPFKAWQAEPVFLEPTALRHSDGIGNFPFEFNIDVAAMARVTASRALARDEPLGIDGMGRSYSIRVVIFTTGSEDKYSVKIPEGLHFDVNGQRVSAPAYEPVRAVLRQLRAPTARVVAQKDPCDRFYGIDISRLVTSGRNQLLVCIDRCMCLFRFGVRLVEMRSDRCLVNQVLAQARAADDAATPSSLVTQTARDAARVERARARVAASFAAHSEAGLQETALRASLRDPISLKRLTTPVRSVSCEHAQCFDLASYVAFQRTDVRMRCPVCSRSATLSELVVDPFFEHVLATLGTDVDDVLIFPDASVKRLDIDDNAAGSGNKRRRQTTAADSAPDRTTLGVERDDDSDDDGDDDAVFRRLKAQVAKPVAAVIDLT